MIQSDHVLHFVKQVLIVRGVAKALRMRHELQRYARSLSIIVKDAESTLAKLETLPTIAEVQQALSNPNSTIAPAPQLQQDQNEESKEETDVAAARDVPFSSVSVTGRVFIGHPLLGKATHAMKHTCTIRGSLPVLRDCHLSLIHI